MSEINRFQFLDDIQIALKLIDDMSSISGNFNIVFRDHVRTIFESECMSTKLMAAGAGVAFYKTIWFVWMDVYLIALEPPGSLKWTTKKMQTEKHLQPSNANPTEIRYTIPTRN